MTRTKSQNVFPGGDKTMPIAIVGMGCRFPDDATSPEKLWDMLMQKHSARRETPPDRFNIDAFHHPDSDKNGTMNNRGGHFLKEDIAAFDAPFFSISPAEAMSMDPMQRLLLEVVYEAMENAGIPMSTFAASNTSCFVGCFNDDYQQMGNRDVELTPKYHAIGTGQSILSNRISFSFDLKGPSVTLDTACSSSLIAIHLACQSLRTGESKAAIVGATNAILSPDLQVAMTNLHFLSPDSTCYTFDERANGYARGEGMAAMILKPLEDAIRDGDVIRAVIRGTAVNSDGKTPGITLPSRDAQVSLIRTAYESSGCDPGETGFFEAHGTGTAAGDPLETGAIGATLGHYRPAGPEGKLYVGSIKTNIGHLEGASGLAGLIKAVLSVEKGIIAPNIWFEKGNPAIDFEGWKIRVPVEATPWPTSGLRRASVNSFGYGGTNGHVIVDDAYHYLKQRGLKGKHRTSINETKVSSSTISNDNVVGTVTLDGPLHLGAGTPTWENAEIIPSSISSAAKKQRPRIFHIAAQEESAMKNIAKAYAEHLTTRVVENDEEFLDNLAYTLCERRSLLQWGNAVVASTKGELSKKFEAISTTIRRSTETGKLGFVFTGQGAQHWSMARELLEHPVFSDSLAACDEIVQKLGASWSILGELLKDEKTSRINEAAISQPLCTAVQIALINLYSTWNIHPARVVGHSSGEIGCGYATGALPLESAMIIAYFRGLLSSNINKLGYKGGMLAAAMSEDDANREIDAMGDSFGKAVVACVNSPRSVTISGDSTALTQLQKIIISKDLFARKLQVDTAYHSHHMLAISEEYHRCMSNIKVTPWEERKRVEMFSSVTGQLVTSEDDLSATYWVKNMVSCVRFSDALKQLCTPRKKANLSINPVDILIELGPHSALAGPVRQVLTEMPKQKSSPIQYLSALIRGKDAAVSTLEVTASLFAQGYPVDIHAAQFPGDLKPNLSVLVDLPSYSWNHSRKYWAESRLSRDYRFRTAPRTDILGAPFHDWNPIEPRWRNFIRISEQPWVKSHMVQGAIIYPAAGYCCMALQAAAQMSVLSQTSNGDRQQTISEFKIRNVAISRALVIPQTEEGVEVVFSMRPNPTSSVKSSDNWSEFRTFSYTAVGGWAEHCRGLVGVVYKNAADEDLVIRAECYARLEAAKDACGTTVDSDELYKVFDAAGLSYGPEFRGILELSIGQGQAIGSVEVTDTRSVMPQEFEFDRLLHPATMDTFLQLAIAGLSQGDIKKITHPYVPTFIHDVSVSGSIMAQTGQMFQLVADARFDGFREAYANITALNKDSLEPVIRIDGVKFLGISASGNSSSNDVESVIPKHIYTVAWEPDVDLVTKEDLDLILRAPLKAKRSRSEDLELLAWYFTDRLLKKVKDSEPANMLSHHQQFFNYMRYQNEMVRSHSHEQQTDEWTKLEDPEVAAKINLIIQKFSDPRDYEGRMIVRMGQALPEVLGQEIEPYDLMMEDNLLIDYYNVGVGTSLTHPQLQRYVTLLSHKYPDLDYLEIGAGPGGATGPVLEALSGCDKHKYPRFKSYTYTDISSSFFDEAAEKYDDWSGLISFKRLNIEEDPDTQGFLDERFDVIIAANVLHATYEMSRTLTNVRKLLRPGGKLILLDMTHERLSTSLIFGNLPIWWNSSEPERKHGPLLDEDQWERTLKKHGFTDLQASVPDFLNPLEEGTRVMVVTAIERAVQVDGINGQATSAPAVIIRPKNITKDGEQLLGALETTLVHEGVPIEICSLSQLQKMNLTENVCISLAEFEEALLPEISSSDFAILRRLTQQSAGLLWITRGGTWISGTRPEFSLFHGMARSLRAEREGFPCVTIDFDAKQKLPANQAAELICKVYQQILDPERDYSAKDREFSEKEGALYIKRAVEDSKLNRLVAARTKSVPLGAESQDIWKQERPLKLKVQNPGSLDSFVFDDDLSFGEPIDENQVEIEVRAVGLNFRDVLVSMGEIGDNYLGNECAGVVTKIGSAVNHLSVGDRVAAWCLGSFATKMRNPSECVQRIPDSMSFSVAAALPLIYVTVYYGLIHLAHLSKGESVLIHSAAGGVGQAAIQIAKLIGAEIFVTVGTEEKKKHVIETYGIGEDHIFSSRDLTFARAIHRATGGRGVDVLLNSLAGEALQATWNCISPFGRFIEIGKRDIDVNSRLEMAPFARNVLFASVDVTVIHRQDKKLAGEIFSKVFDMVRAGEIKEPSPLTVEPFSKIEDCFRIMQAGKHIGKIVLEPRARDFVSVMPKPLKNVAFPADATYLLAGGLGGIGRSISRWMARNGARNIIYVSRHGGSTPKSTEFIKEMHAAGVCTELVKCDISNEKKLSEAIAKALKYMPPIRGVIQAAMVLNDQVLSNMDFDSFTNTIRPKVQGSWSLHKATLEQPLDFFILLSSVMEFIGNVGQSNYVAACAYQVALAAHRNGLDLPATAIDLGKVAGVGVVAENAGSVSEQNLVKLGLLDIHEDELFAILELAMMPQNISVKNGHMLTGAHSTIDASKEDRELIFWSRDPVFSHLEYLRPHLKASLEGKNTADAVQHPLPKLLPVATSLQEANAAVLDALLRKLSRSLMMPVEDINANRSTGAHGIDSLIAVEIRNWLFREAKVDLPVFEILQAPTLIALSEKVAANSPLVSAKLKEEE